MNDEQNLYNGDEGEYLNIASIFLGCWLMVFIFLKLYIYLCPRAHEGKEDEKHIPSPPTVDEGKPRLRSKNRRTKNGRPRRKSGPKRITNKYESVSD